MLLLRMLLSLMKILLLVRNHALVLCKCAFRGFVGVLRIIQAHLLKLLHLSICLTDALSSEVTFTIDSSGVLIRELALTLEPKWCTGFVTYSQKLLD